MKRLMCLTVLLLTPCFTYAQPPVKYHRVYEMFAEKSGGAKEFIRVKKKDGTISALEIAVTRYQQIRHKEGPMIVDLVGVVHIGDTDYYRRLNQYLAEYDTVLYELVSPEGTKPMKGKRKDDSLLAMLPKLMSFFLDLDMQMSVIDYHKKNFVHADMSFDEMAKVMADRGDDKLTLGLSILVDTMRKSNLDKKGKKGVDSFENVDFSKMIENPNILKRIMAAQMVETADLGHTINKLLVEDRNKKVIQVLAKLPADKKKVAIFYGAAHNHDFNKRLLDMGFVAVYQEWVPAWDNLNGEPTPVDARLLKMLLKELMEK